MKRIPFLIMFLGTLVISVSSYKKVEQPKNNSEKIARWTGDITMEEITNISAPGWTGKSERHVHAFFTNALPTMYRDVETTDLDFTDDKGTGTYTYHSEANLSGIKGCTDCEGSGKAELHSVVIREWDNTYDIEVISPACNGTNCDGTPYGPESPSVTVSNHRLGTNKNVLSGTITTTGELAGSMGTFTKTITWHFVREKEDTDAELIVTPVDYNNWLPEPGRNELSKGNVITINLKLQGKNGKPLKVKAESFELHLYNTSIEKGITINYPLEPDQKQLPDLRFIHRTDIESVEEDQSITVASPDGKTGKAFLASYDGGGWTVLKAEAILDDDDKTRVQGRLLKPGGEIDIRIPKRDPNSKIAEAWLKENGNPDEMDDKEESKDNANNGDGFTAYEEYRGVISELQFGKTNPNKFGRLDPNKKEVGVWASKSDFALFDEGIGWFKNASGLKIIRFDFDRNEVAPDGKINMNAKSAHDYDQYALYLLNGGLRSGVLGKVYTKNQKPDIPAQIISVVADWTHVQSAYQNLVGSARPEILKFTLSDYLAQTVAHELGHAINIWHHGVDSTHGPWVVNDISDHNRIFDRSGNLITIRPYTLSNIGDSTHTVEAGDLACMMNYYPYYSWGYKVGADGANIFNKEPLIPLGKTFCKSKNATGFNATQLYFGDADNNKGNCLRQIKLRN